MNATSLISVSAAVVAVVLLVVAYGKYRAAAKLASTWKALALAKEKHAKTLETQLAAKEAALRDSEKARLARMPPAELADVFRGMYGPRRTPGK